MKKPLIGLTCYSCSKPDWSDQAPSLDTHFLFTNYSSAVEGSGGIPLLIPVLDDLGGTNRLMESLDGLILTGGVDIDPANYDQEPLSDLGRVEPGRDRLELDLVRLALERGMPVLGICRGVQIINVALGGTLIQDIPAQAADSLQHAQKSPKSVNSHSVRVMAGSRFHGLIGADQVRVNSGHHQAVDRLASDLVAVGLAPDGIVEAVERPGSVFFMGVQWHPEGTWPHDEASCRLFSGLVEASADWSASRSGDIADAQGSRT